MPADLFILIALIVLFVCMWIDYSLTEVEGGVFRRLLCGAGYFLFVGVVGVLGFTALALLRLWLVSTPYFY